MRVKMKVDLDETDSPTDTAYRSGDELQLDDKDGKALVSGGFADELDDRGYPVENESGSPQSTEAEEEPVEEEDDLESYTNDELREMGATGRTKAELIASLSE